MTTDAFKDIEKLESWISYLWSYLGAKGRAGFVMSSQASSAGHGEKEVRKKIIETGDVDVMISIRSNFFYTRSVSLREGVESRRPVGRRLSGFRIERDHRDTPEATCSGSRNHSWTKGQRRERVLVE